jgi:hypothetical protein
LLIFWNEGKRKQVEDSENERANNEEIEDEEETIPYMDDSNEDELSSPSEDNFVENI